MNRCVNDMQVVYSSYLSHPLARTTLSGWRPKLLHDLVRSGRCPPLHAWRGGFRGRGKKGKSILSIVISHWYFVPCTWYFVKRSSVIVFYCNVCERLYPLSCRDKSLLYQKHLHYFFIITRSKFYEVYTTGLGWGVPSGLIVTRNFHPVFERCDFLAEEGIYF